MPGVAFALFSSCFAWLGSKVRTGDIDHFDDKFRALFHGTSRPGLTLAMKGVSDVGSPLAGTLLTVAAVLVLWALSRRLDAFALAVTIAGSNIIDHVLKVGFHRPRPVPFFNVPVPDSFSFPSGHALAALCFYGMIAHLSSAQIRRLGKRSAIWIAATLITAVIGFSRVYLGVHYPSDVAGGYAAGAAWLALIILAESIYKNRAVRLTENRTALKL